MLVFISVDQFFEIVDLFIHGWYSFNELSMYVHLGFLFWFFFCAGNLNEQPELIVKKSVVLHIRFGEISILGDIPLKKSPVSSG